MVVVLRLVFGVMCVWGLRAGVAQTAVDGAVVGRVVSAAGKPVAGVRIVVRAVDQAVSSRRAQAGADRGMERSLTTDKEGRFAALRLYPGTYLLQAEGIEHAMLEELVTVELGDVTEKELRFAATGKSPEPKPCAGAGSERGPAPVIPATVLLSEPTVEQLSRGTLEQLPLDGRRWEDTALLSPEAHAVDDESGDPAREAEDGERREEEEHPDGAALLSFRGLAPTQNVSLLDGVSGDQVFRGGARGGAAGGARAGSTFAQGAVGRFRVAPHGYSAQYGGAAGGVLAVATARGGEAVHGGAFYLVRASALAASNPFALATQYRDGAVTTSVVKPEDRDQQFGGRVGGPIAVGRLRDRLSGFGSVEATRREFPAVSAPAGTAFYALTPVQSALLLSRGVSQAATRAALTYLDSLTGTVARSAERGLEFGRLDLRAGAQDQVAVSYSRSRLSSPAGSGSGPSTAVVSRGVASVGDSTVRVDATTGRWLHLFGTHFTNEVRVQFVHDLEFERPRAPLTQEQAIGPEGFAPQVSIGGVGDGTEFRYGTPAALGRQAYPDERRLQAAEIAQWAPGKHLFTVGADWSRVDERIDALNNPAGSFTYDSGATAGRAGGLVDWITDYTFNVGVNPNGGCPSIRAAVHTFCYRSFTQSFGQQQVRFTMHEFAGFAQDLWRLRPGLTVELGARYEYTLLPLPQAPNRTLDAAFAGSGATSTFPEDRNNAGPRVALAWAPGGGRWGTLRAGYGVYFGRLPGSTVRAALEDTALPAAATHIRITPTTTTACPQATNQLFGFLCTFDAAPPSAVAATTSATVFARGFRLPVVQQAELTVERDWHGVRALLTYSTAWGTQLPNSTDINIASSTATARFALLGGDAHAGVRDGETFAVPLYTARVATQFGPVTMLESNANATWNGLTGEIRMRARGGVALRGSYTWSKAIDFGAEQGVVPRVNGQFDPFNVRVDKGLADANLPQRFAGEAVWLTRLAQGPKWVREATTGWRLAGIGTASSGRPYSYEVFGGTNLSGGAYSINGSGGSAYLPTVGRNTLRLPARWNADVRLGRSFRVAGRIRGEGFAEVFNVANHPNAARVNARAFLVGSALNGVTPLVFQNATTVAAEGLNTTAFGTVTSSTAGTTAERQVQLGLRLDF